MSGAVAIQSKQMGVAEDYLGQYAALRRSLPGADLPWLASLRDGAAARFQTHGLPTSALEAWKFTHLDRLAKRVYAAVADEAKVTTEQIAHFRFAGLCEILLVFVDGRFRADLSDPQLGDAGALPKGVSVMSLARALAKTPDLVRAHLAGPEADPAQALAALNLALSGDGAVIHLAANAKLDQPLHLLHLSSTDGAASHLRHLVIAESGSAATVVETFAALAPQAAAWTNVVTQVSIAEDATLRHYKLQAESADVSHTSASDVTLAARARYDSFAFAAGGAFSRHEVRAKLTGDEAVATLNGVVLGRDRQMHAQRTDVAHHALNTTLSETYKSVLDGRAHGAFLGKIHVAPGARGTDAQQSNRNLLLSDHAVADTKPELEIYADDVKCAHGATVGDLEREPLFYLRARGIGETEARALLIEAFAAELIDRIADEPARAHFRNQLTHWLEQK
ncbi:MAG TPA: Fe-S cluster assembly protein SufD [Alphaproteobacteria bacterium]|nr:Fe-S cluster assembly protein SufD [Alphaproteobacteria bacterium]